MLIEVLQNFFMVFIAVIPSHYKGSFQVPDAQNTMWLQQTLCPVGGMHTAEVMTKVNSQGRQSGWHEIISCSKPGEQEQERVLVSLGLHQLFFIMRQTPPPSDLPDP